MREMLELRGLIEEFLIIDDRTADSRTIWYVTTTDTSKYYTAKAIETDDPLITHKREGFMLWQDRYIMPSSKGLVGARISICEGCSHSTHPSCSC